MRATGQQIFHAAGGLACAMLLTPVLLATSAHADHDWPDRPAEAPTSNLASPASVTAEASQLSAIDWEYDYATALNSSSDGPWKWLDTNDVAAAFAEDGDWFFLADDRVDGYHALVDWRLKNSSGTLVRGGQIKMTLGGGESRYKNKNFTEGYALTWRVCRGKGTGLDNCSDWTTQAA